MALKDLAKLVAESSKTKSIEEQFLYDLENTITKIDSDNARKPSKCYSPSMLGTCLRAGFFQITGAPIDEQRKSSEIISIAESGTDRHLRIQTWITRMQEAGFDCEWIDVEKWVEERKPEGTIVVNNDGLETKCFNRILNISFKCDGIIKYKGNYYILEIKTEDNFKWQTHTQPHKKHIIQATAYSICLGIDEIIFIYENRNFCSRKSSLLKVTNEMKQELVINYIEECNNYINNNEVPPKTDNISECTYCPYKTECKRW